MSASPKNLYTKAMDLDVRDRTDLVAMLLESLDHGSDEGVETAWIEEAKRRLDAVDSGQVKPVPWSEERESRAAFWWYFDRNPPDRGSSAEVPVEVQIDPAAEHESRAAFWWYFDRNPTVADAFRTWYE